MHIPSYTCKYNLMYLYVFGTYLMYVYARILVSICMYCTYLYVFKAWKSAGRIYTCKYVQYVHILTKYVQNTAKIRTKYLQIHTKYGHFC